jgi:hypothetical protein
MLVSDLIYYKDGEGNIMSSGYKVNSILLKTNTPVMETLSKKYENLAVPCGLYYFNKPYSPFINIGGNNDNDSDIDDNDDVVNDDDDNDDVDNNDVVNDDDDVVNDDDDNDDVVNDDDENITSYNDETNIINGGKNIISNDLYEKLLEMVKINKKINKTKKNNKSKSKKVKKTKKNN